MQHYNFSDTYKQSVESGTKFQKAYKTWAGKGTLQYKPFIQKIIETHNIKTVLDFGCGKGIQYSTYNLDKELNYEVLAYDPCIHGLDNWPKGNYDLVLALDCISLIDIRDYKWMYEQFSNWATKAVFIATQIGNDGKEAKKRTASEILPLSNEQDLLLHSVFDSAVAKFYIMNNHRFIHE